jgi:hypothetical protein
MTDYVDRINRFAVARRELKFSGKPEIFRNHVKAGNCRAVALKKNRPWNGAA